MFVCRVVKSSLLKVAALGGAKVLTIVLEGILAKVVGTVAKLVNAVDLVDGLGTGLGRAVILVVLNGVKLAKRFGSLVLEDILGSVFLAASTVNLVGKLVMADGKVVLMVKLPVVGTALVTAVLSKVLGWLVEGKLPALADVLD